MPDEVIVNRLSKRRVHRLTGESYHLDFKPPPNDVDPDLILQRDDDRPESIRHRLRAYHRQTEPVEAYYQQHGPYYQVQGVGTFQEVQARIEQILQVAVPLSNKTA